MRALSRRCLIADGKSDFGHLFCRDRRGDHRVRYRRGTNFESYAFQCALTEMELLFKTTSLE
jgi:hypothetical protein